MTGPALRRWTGLGLAVLAALAAVAPSSTYAFARGRPAATVTRRRASGYAPPSLTLPAQPVERSAGRALVVAVAFKGTTPTVRASHWQSTFFGSGPNSVATYLSWASYGQFRLTGSVVGGAAAGQTSDWLVVPHSVAYYAQGNSGMGKTEGDNVGAAGGDLLEQTVVAMLDKAHFNWTPYLDATGNVPYLILVVDSADAALTGSGSDLWSYEESQSNTPVALAGGKKALVENYDLDAAYGENTTQLNGYGTFCHEFAHILGAIDVYDSNGSIAGLANWSLMGSGNYNGPAQNGTQPSDLDAFHRILFGWSTPVLVQGPPVLTRLAPSERSPAVLEYPIPGTEQYYLFENRQPLYSDVGLPGHGLLIYRVDGAIMNEQSAAWDNDCVDCVTGTGKNPHPGIILVQSDGSQSLDQAGSAGDTGSMGDPWPGSSGATTFNDATKPSARGWGGVPSYLSVSGITQEADGAIVMAIGSDAASLSPSAVGGAGGAVTVTDPLGPFKAGDAISLLGAPSGSLGKVTVVSPTQLRFHVLAQTPAGAYLVEVTGPAGGVTQLAYLVVTGAGAPGAPATVSLRVSGTPVPGQAVTVHLSLLDAAGRVDAGNFGPVWLNGRPVALAGGVGTATLTVPASGVLALDAALYALPSVAGATQITARA